MCLIIAGGHVLKGIPPKPRKRTKTTKKGDAYRNSWNSALLVMLHHQIDVLRSFVLLHDSPSARLADRVLMIHELRGYNPTPTKSFTSSAHLLCVLFDREFPVICLVILQLCFDIHIPNDTRTFPFLCTLLWRFCHDLKRPGCLWFNTIVLEGEI